MGDHLGSLSSARLPNTAFPGWLVSFLRVPSAWGRAGPSHSSGEFTPLLASGSSGQLHMWAASTTTLWSESPGIADILLRVYFRH